MSRTLIMDTETNGIGSFKPAKQRIVQWSWITPDGEERNFFIKGAQRISKSVPHDITVEQLNAHGKSFITVYNLFKKDLDKCDRIIAHNAKFDIGCIQNEMKLHGFSRDDQYELDCIPVYCTMVKSLKYCAIPQITRCGEKTNLYKWPRLDELYECLFGHFPEGKLHDSLWDCRILKKCFVEGLKRKIFVI